MLQDLVHCKLSSLAYKNPSDFPPEEITNFGYESFEFINVDGAQAYVCISDVQITFVFRGTEPKEPSDVVADLKAWKQQSRVAGKVHDGFYGELEKIWSEIESIALLHSDKICTITGHSLGAAMATICAARFQGKFKSIKLFTYGSPRVGNKKFINSLSFDHDRWVNNNDAVTKVPPVWLFYKHHGELKYLNYYGNVRDGYSLHQRLKDMLRSRIKAIKKWQFFKGVYDHSISNYEVKLAKIEEKNNEA